MVIILYFQVTFGKFRATRFDVAAFDVAGPSSFNTLKQTGLGYCCTDT